ncbi:MAG: efflux RND transporter periplasmic adaptor subunit [Steroidobacteraceae bacterium]|jgi:membrane fusion protein (multidrug efflux system)|nr:efflux RND transporter periplasmic adaptor subunit [Steroidobacteraceae bacterium]
MSQSRSLVTPIAVAVAIVCAGWAIYATKHAGSAPAGGFGPPGMGGPPGVGGPPGMGGRAGAAGPAGKPGAAGGASRPGAGGAAGPGRPGGGPPGGGGPGSGMPTPVVSIAVREQPLASELQALGTARANESVEVSSKTSNVVTAVRFRDGQRVQRGQVLVELDSAQARADLAAAQAALTDSSSQLTRSRELLPTQALSKSQFDQVVATQKADEARVAAARARLEDTVIRAPFSGRVGLRRISVGSLINPGTVITTLDDSSVMKVDFAVPEVNLSQLREGLSLTATSTAWPGRRFSGRVTSVDSRIDPVSRSVVVRAEVPNPEALLKPGMFLNVEIVRDRRTALVVPEEALVPEQDRQYVFVVDGGTAQRREVRIGARSPGSVEILAGLAAGERVIVEGTVKVREGGAVRDLAMAGPPPGAPGATGERARPARPGVGG